jgi:hypothetical protein
MKRIPAQDVKEGQVIAEGHYNFYVLECDSGRENVIILRGVYHDPLPGDESTAVQILHADDFVTVY